MSLKPQAVQFDDRWVGVKKVMLQVLAGKSVQKKIWTSCFSDIYSLCTAFPISHAPRLYTEVKNIFLQHVDNVLRVILNNEYASMLKEYCHYWDIYSTACYAINNLFSYMNNQCMKQHNNFVEQKGENLFITDFLVVNDLGLQTWGECLLSHLKDKLTSLVLTEIHRNRLGNSIENQEVILKTINSFRDTEKYKREEDRLKLYESSLEEPYLQQVMDFYRQKSLDLADSLGVQEYISKCLQLLDEESWRAKRFMSTSYDKILDTTRQMIVIDHLDFINAHCKSMIESQNEEGLSNTYLLLHFSSKAISHMVTEYQIYVENMCLDILKNLKDENMASNLCESLIDIHDVQSALIKKVFVNYPGFIASLDKGFNNTINKVAMNNRPVNQKWVMTISPVPDLLVKYCDQLLKKAAKGLNDNDLDDKLSGIITIFKYLEDKDVFNKIYSKHLARRLIYALSQSMDAEEAMIKKLKLVCGHEYTGKLQRMLTDVTISRELNSKFFNFVGSDSSSILGLSFSILVMQTGAWPLQITPSTFAIPQELEKSLQQFEKFYQGQFNGRKLIWYHTCSTCEVKFNFSSRSYILHTSLHIMSVLMLFNNADLMTFSEVMVTTGIGQEDLLRCLQLLIENNILLCDNGSTATTESTFTLNLKYKNKRPKFKLLTQIRENMQETERTLNTVTDDRKMFIQAVIVRTMKARKRMHHKVLVDEVVRQSLKHFVPNHSFIKKMIEYLIERQYLERMDDSIDEYNYVA